MHYLKDNLAPDNRLWGVTNGVRILYVKFDYAVRSTPIDQ